MAVLETVKQFEEKYRVYFSEQQAKLDEFIRNKQNIDKKEWQEDIKYQWMHDLALKNEVAEFINECRDIWKYWKQKPVDKEKLLDEFVDIVHFTFLIRNKYVTDYDTPMHELLDVVSSLDEEKMDRQEPNDVFHLRVLSYLDLCQDYEHILGHALYILFDRYFITVDEIKEAYDKKNKENHERQENNY